MLRIKIIYSGWQCTFTMMDLANPELELIDPTPNIHSLFLHFDKTFFWGQLSSRCAIRWSKRMFSCAGTCSYEPSQRFCDIALSEPLLKLRPRKDLVETMLHEMIHAYLFITNQDQNRDGHGPNFKMHMYRINSAAGLHITVYHSFHDEVKLYQTHWWRCNGPCQSQRPYFGIVRRSCNRPPGPSDNWWNYHQRVCGGSFIKIKEPEPKVTKKKKASVAKPNADITKYVNKNNNNNNINNKIDNKNIKQKDKPKPVLKDSSNMLDKPETVNKNNNINIYIEPKKNVIYNPQVPKSNSGTFTGTGITQENTNKIANTQPDSSDVLETVRSIWVNKQLTTNKQIPKKNESIIEPNLNKHKPDYHIQSPPTKMKKIDDYFKTSATSVLKDLYGKDFHITQSKDEQKLKAIPKENNLVDCPICKAKMDSQEINRHLDECLNKDIIEKLSKESVPIIKNESDKICGLETPGVLIVGAPLKEAIGRGTINQNQSNNVTKQINPNNLIDLTNMGFVPNGNQERSRMSFNGDLKPIKQEKSTTNDINKQRKSDSFMGPSTSKAIQNTSNSAPKAQSDVKKPHTVKKKCPCCGIKLSKGVNEHFDECLAFFQNNDTIPVEGGSTSYINDTIVINDSGVFDDSQTFNDTGTKLPCPCCLAMVELDDMNRHLDYCLK